jgi:EAL domain-containing protein (putative c-di-GMP-specific phosphodiesterase class I)
MRLRGFQDLTVSANVSTREFLQPDFVPRIDLILRSTGLYGRSLKIEVTESVLMDYSEHAAAMLEQLRKLSIGICIDDFGTGYSSFSYLRRFQIDVLKIDRSFVSRMMDDEDSAQIVAVVASLAKNLGKVTVAEGVETESEFARLSELGVDQVQGYYVARPMSAEDAEQLLETVHGADNHLEKIMRDRLARM